jgi:selenocysteine-specific elongation factor
MAAGATGIDHALLVVAADDGVMPQTREHLAVVALLGVREATVAITKIDRIDAALRAQRLAEVRSDVAALLAPTALSHAPMLAVSATTGEGIDTLRERLLEVARQERTREDALAFRLAVDRSFTLSGVGTVVTGTVFSGSVRIGDELRVVPGERTVRVRGIHAQNQQAEAAHAGQRCALALAGVAKDEMHRGDWVCAGAVALSSERIDVLLTLWPGEARPLRSGTAVHAHLGASDVMASVALLDRDALAPGETALAQLVLREAAGAWHGDRGVLRDASATRTVAGVRVLDPFAPVRYRRTPERLRTLAAWAIDDRAARVAALLHSAPLGIDAERLVRALSLTNEAALQWPGDAVRVADTAIAQAHLDALQAQVTERLADFHRASPDEVGPDARRLKRLAAPRTGDALWRHAIDALLARGALVRSGTWLHLPDHAARLNEAEQKLAQKLLPKLADGGFDPPWVRDLAKDCAASERWCGRRWPASRAGARPFRW